LQIKSLNKLALGSLSIFRSRVSTAELIVAVEHWLEEDAVVVGLIKAPVAGFNF